MDYLNLTPVCPKCTTRVQLLYSRDFMVLLEVFISNASYGLYSDHPVSEEKFEDNTNLSLTSFIKLCEACKFNIMAAIPPSAFSSGRIRETQRDMKVSNIKKGSESTKFFNDNLTELSPLKYNSKLMNSIWGIYNRYSPHNVKKITDASNLNSGLQQTAANPGNKNESMLSIPGANLDNVWAANYASQSH